MKRSTYRELAREWRGYVASFGESFRLNERITRHVLDWDVFARADTIMAYEPIESEVRTWDILREAYAQGKRVVLPRTLGRGLMLPVDTPMLAEMTPGWYNIPQPPLGLPIVEKDEIDLVLVPGLRFDRHGNRIGYGGGYYDRFLAGFQGMTCGLAFGAQVSWGTLDVAPHDVPLRALATEKGIRACRTSQ